jgi:hypothetical protein
LANVTVINPRIAPVANVTVILLNRAPVAYITALQLVTPEGRERSGNRIGGI